MNKQEKNPEWIYSEDGLDVKVMDGKGKTKFIPAHLVINTKLMKNWGFEIVNKPKVLEPVFTEVKTDPELLNETMDTEFTETTTDPELLNETTEVAETTPAKRGRKPNQ